MNLEIKKEKIFKYIEVGDGQVMLLLHGLFGALSNFLDVIRYFSPKYKVVIPLLPLYELELEKSNLPGMIEHIEEFIAFKKYKKLTLIGNSLGGHIAQLYALRNLENVKAMVLTGSSGLFESAMGDTYPKKSDIEYVRKKTALTFYDPKVATEELINEVFDIINDRNKAIRVLYIAKSAMRENLSDQIGKITVPVNLVWGKHDTITPPFVAEEFHKLLPNSVLNFIDKCGHAPMMERPEEFNKSVDDFLEKIKTATPG